MSVLSSSTSISHWATGKEHVRPSFDRVEAARRIPDEDFQHNRETRLVSLYL